EMRLRYRPYRRQLEAARGIFGIEPDRVGVGAHEAERVRAAGEVAEASFLDRHEIAGTYAQLVRDIFEVALQCEAHFTQCGAQLERLDVAARRAQGGWLT